MNDIKLTDSNGSCWDLVNIPGTGLITFCKMTEEYTPSINDGLIDMMMRKMSFIVLSSGGVTKGVII